MKTMNLDEAIKVLRRYEPCRHENYDGSLGDGKTWGKCENCGVTFMVENLPIRRQFADEFGRAIDCLLAIKNAVGAGT